MKKFLLLLSVVLSLSLGACSSDKEAIYKAPDETKVKENRPLTLPPDFELRPPRK